MREGAFEDLPKLYIRGNKGEEMYKMENLKQEAINAISKMPAADIDEIMYRLYVIDKVRKGRGEELKREIKSW